MDYYYYRTYFSKDPKDDYRMNVSAFGVSLEFRDGRVLTTKIISYKLFGKRKSLTREEIQSIHKLIKGDNNVFDRVISKKQFDKIKQIYFETRPNYMDYMGNVSPRPVEAR